MQLRLLSTVHRYKRRTSITVNTGENRLVTITTENHSHLTIRAAGLSGDNDDRECERWKEHANDSIVEAKDKSVFNSVGFLIVSY
jgi:hypothetical protein